MRKLLLVLSIIILSYAVYKDIDKPKGDLKPQFSQKDVALQEALVEGLQRKCNEGKEDIFCSQYRVEHQRLQNFYYLPESE